MGSNQVKSGRELVKLVRKIQLKLHITENILNLMISKFPRLGFAEVELNLKFI